jgi:predicted SAM-dependent methyltransferase
MSVMSKLFKFFVWELLNPALLKRKRNKRYSYPTNYLGINLGCGLDLTENWIGVDGGITHHLVRLLPKSVVRLFYKSFDMKKNYTFDDYVRKIKSMRLIHHELCYSIPYDSDVVPNIFSSHFFEHIYHSDAQALAAECFRVLRPGGIIRICVPSISPQIEEMKLALEKYECGSTDLVQPFVVSDIIGFVSTYSAHRYMYNEGTLKELLSNAGFIDAKSFAMHEGEIPDVEKLDTRIGIFVEAKKL